MICHDLLRVVVYHCMNVRELSLLKQRTKQPKNTQKHLHPAVVALRAIRAVWDSTGINPIAYQKQLRQESDNHARKQYGRT